MSTRGPHLALAASLAAAVIALTVLVVPAGSASATAGGNQVAPRFISTPASKRAAREDVARRLAAVVLPPSARRVSPRSPLVNPHLAGRYEFYGPYFLHRIRGSVFVSFPGGTRAAIRWFLDHRPPESKVYGRTAGPGHGPRWYRCLWFGLPEDRPAIGDRSLTVCAAKTHGQTSMRIEAQSVWLEGRSPYERIPRGSRFMEVTVSEGGVDRRSAVIADPARIDREVGLVNSLPVLQHGTCVSNLDAPSRATPRVEVRFRSSPGGWPIARIAGELTRHDPCPPLFFWLRGRNERPLDEGRLVIQSLRPTIERLRQELER